MSGSVHTDPCGWQTIGFNSDDQSKESFDMSEFRLQEAWQKFSGILGSEWRAFSEGSLAWFGGNPEEVAGHAVPMASMMESDRQLADFMSRHRNWQDL
jgi:hypothetical protein